VALRLSHCPRLHDPLASSSSSPIRRLLFTAQLPRHGAASSEVQCPSAVIRRLSQLGTAVLKPRLSSFRTGVLVFLAAVGGGSSFLASPFVYSLYNAANFAFIESRMRSAFATLRLPAGDPGPVGLGFSWQS